MKRPPPLAALSIAVAASISLGGMACDYGSVDPPDPGSPGAGDPGDGDDGSGDDGGGDGSGGADAGASFQHLSFPIEAGTTHAAFGCGDCHGDLSAPGDPAALACTSCHVGSHDQAAMDERHSAGAGVGALFEWSAPACLACHPQADVYTRAEHDGIARQQGHGGVPCSGCHVARSDLTPSTFAETQCTPCHSGTPDD